MLNTKSTIDVQSAATAVYELAQRQGKPELFVKAAIGEFAIKGWLDDPKNRGRIEACCFRAGEIADTSSAVDDQPEQVESSPEEDAETLRSQAAEQFRRELFGYSEPPLPEVLVTSCELLKSLRPQVEQLRRELFGSADPPFDSVEKAVGWIREEAEPDRPVSQEARNNLQNAAAKANKHLFRLASEAGWTLEEVPVAIKLGFLRYPGKAGCSRQVAVPAGSPLVKLAAFTKKAARQTGFNEAGVTAHVLTDLALVLSRLTLHGHIHSGPRPTEYTVTVRAHNPTATDFRAAYAGFFKKRRRVVRVKEIDWRLYCEVLRRGGEPTANKGEWWERTGEAVGLKGAAARMRWRRLPAKLQSVSPDKLRGAWLRDERT